MIDNVLYICICFNVVCLFVSVDHPVSQPIPMGGRRGFPGADAANILSPRDASGGLGVKMVEYVLGGSPTGNKHEHPIHHKQSPYCYVKNLNHRCVVAR